MADPNKHKPHIFLGKNGKREPYTHPGSGGGSNVEVPRRNRQQHGRALQSQQRFDKQARYALIVSISVPDTEIDIYSEVENAIAIQQAT